MSSSSDRRRVFAPLVALTALILLALVVDAALWASRRQPDAAIPPVSTGSVPLLAPSSSTIGKATAIATRAVAAAPPVSTMAIEPATPTAEPVRTVAATAVPATQALAPAAIDPASGLSLEEKIGQMVMLGFDGTDGSGTIADLVQRRHAGNVVLLGNNVVSPGQMVSLTGRLQEMARGANQGIGMLISTDEEGGSVQLLPSPPYANLPSARQMAASGDSASVTARGMLAGQELKCTGINMDLAPVMDVNDNPANPVIGNRAFGVDPQTVMTYGLAFLDGLKAAGVATVVKHFPGHGNTSQDSHLTLPYVTKSAPELQAVELAPFKAAVAQGVSAVMVAHVAYPAWDPQRPASLSPVIIGQILRGELNYQGVVMTDDMNMGAITERYGPGEAAVMAVQAGVDILLIAGPPSTQNAMMDAVLAAVQSGRIPESRIDQSVDRILRLKQQYGLAGSLQR